MAVIITVEMENEQIKNNNSSSKKDEKVDLRKILTIAMLVVLTIIAIVLVSAINSSFKYKELDMKVDISNNSYDVIECNDQNLCKFITDYFNSRTNLNFSKIFSAFGRDYYKEEREDEDGKFKNIINSIRYEKVFVKGYENIKVYTAEGYNEDESVCIVTYDLALGFTNDAVPMIIIFYIKKIDNSFVIIDNFDVGISKHILNVTKSDSVKKIYNDVYTRLNRLLLSNENIKLAYNSLRQFEMNMNTDLGTVNKIEIINEIGPKELDPINDAELIYNNIYDIKEKERKQKIIDEYMERVIASLSDVRQ